VDVSRQTLAWSRNLQVTDRIIQTLCPFLPGLASDPTILGPIGASAMGEVYRATDTKLGRDVAIKILPGVFAQDARSHEAIRTGSADWIG
jgi:serine/threonine protein kinase